MSDFEVSQTLTVGTRSSRDWIEVVPDAAGPRRARTQALTQRNQVAAGLTQLLGENRAPRPGQVEAIYQLLFQDKDVLLQAGTGYGKSAIFQYTGLLADQCLGQTSLTIMISPLNALTVQQVQNLLAPNKGVAITNQLLNKAEVYRGIVGMDFTHVCISPELVCGREFREQVVDHLISQKRRIFFMVDEVHCVDQWLDFRRDYGRFGAVRRALGRGVQSFGTSATLSPGIRKSVLDNGPFKPDYTLLNSTTDRPEIYIDIRFMESNLLEMEDLHWLIPSTSSDAVVGAELRKTIVFFETRELLRRAMTLLRIWLQRAGVSAEVAAQIVRPYYASLTEDTKQAALQAFQSRDSIIRIMLATDAIGMGMDIAGVELVVQYGGEAILKDQSELAGLAQRAGRGARMQGERAAFVWIVPNWAERESSEADFNVEVLLNLDLASISISKQRSKGRHKKAPGMTPLSQIAYAGDDNDTALEAPALESTGKIKSKAQRRAELAPIYQLILWSCPRKAMLRAFHGRESSIWQLPEYPNPACCSFCHPNIRPVNAAQYNVSQFVAATKAVKSLPFKVNDDNVEELLRLRRSATPRIDGKHSRSWGNIVNALRIWRDRTVSAMFEGQPSQYNPQWFCSDAVIKRIADVAVWLQYSHAKELLMHFVPEFEHHELYDEQIIDIIKRQFARADFAMLPTKAAWNNARNNAAAEELTHIHEIRRAARVARYGRTERPTFLAGDNIDRQDKTMVRGKPVTLKSVAKLMGNRVVEVSTKSALAALEPSTASGGSLIMDNPAPDSPETELYSDITYDEIMERLNEPVFQEDPVPGSLTADGAIEQVEAEEVIPGSLIDQPGPSYQSVEMAQPSGPRKKRSKRRISSVGASSQENSESEPMQGISTRAGRRTKPTVRRLEFLRSQDRRKRGSSPGV